MQIAKIANELRMATPEMTGNFGKGMDVLWQAIDELDTHCMIQYHIYTEQCVP